MSGQTCFIHYSYSRPFLHKVRNIQISDSAVFPIKDLIYQCCKFELIFTQQKKIYCCVSVCLSFAPVSVSVVCVCVCEPVSPRIYVPLIVVRGDKSPPAHQQLTSTTQKAKRVRCTFLLRFLCVIHICLCLSAWIFSTYLKLCAGLTLLAELEKVWTWGIFFFFFSRVTALRIYAILSFKRLFWKVCTPKTFTDVHNCSV